MLPKDANIDPKTVASFGEEWSAFDQTELTPAEYKLLFDSYFSIFPFERLVPEAEGFDLGCGSGRWALGVAKRVGTLHCIDPSAKALAVARAHLRGVPNVQFHCSSVDEIPLADDSQDFGYSLGVLHHVPDTRAALSDCVRKLKPGAPFLVYLYYALDGRPAWFRALWGVTDVVRRRVAELPFPVKHAVTDLMAASLYWPLARAARLAEALGASVRNVPLASYRKTSFYTMRTDALDRFGTRLEQRFTREQIEEMMASAGLIDLRFSETPPFWVACGHRAA